MLRVQVSDEFGGQPLTTHARTMAATEQAAPPVQDTRWRELADVFAQGAGLAETVGKQAHQDDEASAQRYAQSLTVGELGKAVKEGRMMPSQSPVFVGTVQHIWGANSHEAGLRDIQSKLTKGELKFNSPQEADQYLTEWRNSTLAGQSKYAQAGFDKAYPQTREKLMDGVNRQNDKEWVDNAQVQATDFLANSVNTVTGKDFAGTPQDAAKQLLDQYQLMRHTMTLPEGARKGALQEMLTRLAGSGHTGVLNAMLDSKLEDIGSLRSFIGEAKALTLSNQATHTFDGAQRQRIDDEALPWYQAADKGELNVEKLRAWGTSAENKKYVTSAFINSIENANQASLARLQRDLQSSALQIEAGRLEADAQQRTLAAFREGRLYEVQGVNRPQVMSASGDLKDFDVDKFITKAGAAMTSKLPFEQQVHSFAANGLEHPDWKNQSKRPAIPS
ncbi:hypothetical protein [Variovorax sp. J31P207]|uniref:hypothetical protein n=1 Tax=Variovorax sp. J31P207 TaxID=3053510 RepID=UPI0025764C60|nr:hypothetical protein [Variovorax sp. J31P207]MDM0071860.1 hypothetical protein [Variovorax sp. J31P207]